MKVILGTPFFFSEKGLRASNQDYIYCPEIQDQLYFKTFVICDGVGGAKDGQIASTIAAEGFGKRLNCLKATEPVIDETINAVQLDIDEYLKANPQSIGMGTTMALVQFHQNGLSVAHIGDSRVYHIRGESMLFCTEDHSLAMEMKKQGLIEKIEHVQKNVITRALQGNFVKSVRASIYFSSDIQKGDFIILCTDGVWGCFSEEEFLQIFSQELDSKSIIDRIWRICEQNSKDNYSMILLYVSNIEVDEDEYNQPYGEQLYETTVGANKVRVEITPKMHQLDHSKILNFRIFFFIIILFLIYMCYRCMN